MTIIYTEHFYNIFHQTFSKVDKKKDKVTKQKYLLGYHKVYNPES